jgi:hypothetical protein
VTVGDPIAELHSTRLYLHLVAQSPEYATRITKFVAAIAPILATTCEYFPYYTRHDAHHGFRVTLRLAQVVCEQCFDFNDRQSLRPAEIFLLIAAAYAHDLGMTVFPGEEEKLKADLGIPDIAANTDKRLTDYLRLEHSKRGGHYILENATQLGVPENLIGALDWMMRSHNLAISKLDQDLREPFAAEERELDVRQLAAILCIGDALEFSDTRVVEGVVELAKADESPAAQFSYRENRKHVGIGDSLAISDDGQVVVSGTFTEPEVLASALRTLDETEEWVRGYCDIDRSSRVPRLRIRPEPFSRRLEIPGARFARLGVRMSKRSVIDLIASNAVWRNDEGIAIRELVQNAVEACRYREHHSSKAHRYSPQVQVVFDRDNRTITVRDNGCGMSERTVLNHFLTVGSSRSKEAAYADAEYAPIARFGIGFWSVFTISTYAHIETSPFEQAALGAASSDNIPGFSFDVALDEMKDYTVFVTRPVRTGTSVTLHLKPSIVLDDVFERARASLLVAAVETTMFLDGEVTSVPRDVPDISAAELLGARQRAMEADGVRVFQRREEVNETELALAIAYRLKNGVPTFLANESESLTLGLGFRFTRTAICGFQVVAPRERTCFAIERIGSANTNHRSPRGFEFSIDRQSLVENDASLALSRDATDLVHRAYRDFLKATNAYTPEHIFRLNEESELNGGNVFDQYTGRELWNANERWADLLCYRLLQVDVKCAYADVVPIYVDLPELLKLRGNCWMIQTRVDKKLADGRSYSIYEEQLHPIAYSLVQATLRSTISDEPFYILDANRPASMLFDADPDSTVEMRETPYAPWGNVIITACLQRVSLTNLQLDPERHNIMVEVRGRWTGAVYVRNFSRPDGKPYVFLGRHRVLVHHSSLLRDHLENLKANGQLIKIATLIADLQEDDQGFTPTSLAGLL